MSSSMDHVVVIGGGLAGSMLGLKLAVAGREVVLLEKQREAHDKVCGEFLSAEAIGYLHRAGVDVQAAGAHPIQRVCLHTGRKSVHAQLPFQALSLSRRVLDESLMERAGAAGCEVRRGAFVEKLSRGTDGFSTRIRGGETIHAHNVFLATGKHDLAGQYRSPGAHRDLVGFKMHWRLSPKQTDAIRHAMELFLFRGGYGGIALVENDFANLCFVMDERLMRKLDGWPGLLGAIRKECRAVDQILLNATPCWSKPLAISPIPYGYIAKASDGIWRVGDQAAVIPSFTGDGMSIALHSAELAAEMFLSGRSPDEYLGRLHDHLHAGMRFATALSRMMVTTTGRLLAPAALSLVPGAISWIAKQTRIPARDLLKTDAGPGPTGDHLPASAA
jgi:menaquinone-9 beta-reductase